MGDYDAFADAELARLSETPVTPITGTEPMNTWVPVPLADIIAGLQDGTLEAPKPTLGTVGDKALLYPGRVNVIFGDSSSGKTWTGLVIAREAMHQGPIVWLDYEDNAVGTVGRLLAMGVDADIIATRFVYIHPSEKLTPYLQQQLLDLVAELKPALVVVDSEGESLSMQGCEQNKDEDIARWSRLIPRPIAELGPAVLLIDHQPKRTDGIELYAIGSQRKRAIVTGAQYLQKVIKPFSREKSGYSILTVAKDREGAQTQGTKVARLAMSPTLAGVSAVLEPVEDDQEQTGPFRPTHLMEKVSRLLEGRPEPLSQNIIKTSIKGKALAIVDGLTILAAEGFVTVQDGPRGAKLYSSIKPFRESQDAGNKSAQNDDLTGSDLTCSLVPPIGGEQGTSQDEEVHLFREQVGNKSGTSDQVGESSQSSSPPSCRLHGLAYRPDVCFTCQQIVGDAA